ncbi:DUF1273 domain-containing protein [Carnobacterium divergens]|uniref:UPF0398 protein CKN69_10365 n=1 Tax=Carnobacterium divergens TaxID=2748 RepID=A0A7Z8G3K9_CARDV|nr:DUF1273 domain-containing protein [Carnobacterium divergens]TFI71430.1 hypothetical protein CKN58_10355 [Carnobacterium divergens]TFI76072.1 hypothetical protein CKN85_10410 [Carnobacterium divergens]TFI81944.1 hypothetical protein CKN56_10435 [Carnobacterium divergens]TFI94253.1 hypothetical protein CKN64_10375 [Carnobacterium divergens]TFJ10533.1 hypothetical protein CKN60_10405 [Carnobacterium divergens]
MANLVISGYRSFELGVFKEDDPKIAVIKKCLTQEITQLIENNQVEWILIGGQSGVEQWAAEVVQELKKDYPQIKYSVIFPFYEFGSNWNETNQLKLQKIKQAADYTDSTSHKPYESPVQLKNHQQFLLDHSELALLVYDPEFEGKTKYLYEAIQRKQEKTTYECLLIDFDQLQNQTFE